LLTSHIRDVNTSNSFVPMTPENLSYACTTPKYAWPELFVTSLLTQ